MVLRVHWYDSARNGVPDARQERIGELSKVKLRLGRFGVNGEQKGVDLRIGLDLVAYEFFLVSSSNDLDEAQVHGVQVVVRAVLTVDSKLPWSEPAPDPSRRRTPQSRRRDSRCCSDEGRPPATTRADHPGTDTRACSARNPGATRSRPDPSRSRVHSTEPGRTTFDEGACLQRPDRLARTGATRIRRRQRAGSPDRRSRPAGLRIVPGELPLTTNWNSSAQGRDIGRALLLDASDVMEKYDLDEGIQYPVAGTPLGEVRPELSQPPWWNRRQQRGPIGPTSENNKLYSSAKVKP